MTRVSFPAAARDFLPESSFSADSYGVRTAPVCNRMLQHQCTRLTIPNAGWVPFCTLFGHAKIVRTPVEMGSAALAAAAALPRQGDPNFPQGINEIIIIHINDRYRYEPVHLLSLFAVAMSTPCTVDWGVIV